MSGRTGHDLDDGPGDVGLARYGDDYYRWALEQADLLRSGRVNEIDCMNIAEEIAALGRPDYRALQSDLAVILHHMLKWDFQSGCRSRSWEITIREHRRRVFRALEDSPGLRAKVAQATIGAFEDGRDRAWAETGLPDHGLPEVCPYSWIDIMERPFVVDAE